MSTPQELQYTKLVIELGHVPGLDIQHVIDYITDCIEETGPAGDEKFEPLFTFEVYETEE